ncbi:MAG TPA: hypothetical protein VLA20_05330 [Vicinamibacterales bacterium]|nr:hypothetical protein [Vicinamibacterales bacterium]
MSPAEQRSRRWAGWLGALVVFVLYAGLAVNVDVPAASAGIFSDEATYYLMGHSLAADGDLEYRREDLERVYREYPTGPAGVFLKRGTDVTGFRLTLTPPFVEFPGIPDQDQARLYYGKSFIYPLAAAPFVWLFGTNGFLLFNALLLAAAFVIAYSVASRLSGTTNGMLVASAFVFATVVPVYAVWVTPELFNFVLGLAAYYLWLSPRIGGLPSSEAETTGGDTIGDRSAARAEILAGALVGVATFSKVTNVLLVLPMVAWQAYRRQWRQALATGASCVLAAALLFGANVAISGEWNYQGGRWGRSTCYGTFPFQSPGAGLEVCDERARNEALGNVIFDPEVFWSNLGANLQYFFVGRNSGLVAYFFPVVFGMAALVAAGRRRRPWQWFVLGGVVVQILLFVITLPNTYFGGGGSVGNRYFMGVYGICLFLIPPIRSRALALVPWLVGGAFMAELVMNPFYTSSRPFEHQKTGLFKLLPVEKTNVNDLPLMNQRERNFWWGDDPALGYPGFQIFYLDDNSYLQESDRLSLWIRGGSRAEWLIRTANPASRLQLHLRAGPVATDVTIRVEGRRQRVALEAGGEAVIVFELPPGFPYKHDRPPESPGPTYVWMASIASSHGFTPALVEPGSPDVRHLGVLVTPYVIP